jgi:pyruvate/2-oxoglutarate dehydrogenase complex dihydrolipoamide acyltransferase (E2) component
MATEVVMPSLGESVFEGTISSWLKKEGDEVERYEPILEIETDKVTTEATAEISGTLLKIVAQEGDTVAVGSVLAYIGDPTEDLSNLASYSTKEVVIDDNLREPPPLDQILAPATQQPPANGPTQQTMERYTGRISPVVSRIAGEHDINLDHIKGTGREGRITKKDILAYIETRESSPSSMLSTHKTQRDQPVGNVVPGELITLTSIRRAIAEHMVLSKRTSPHVTTIFEIDFNNVATHRLQHKASFTRDGVNLTFTAYIIAAMVQALRAHPVVNSTWTEKGILVKQEINIGMATAIDDGLIVPVIKHADGLSLLAISRAVNDLANRARLGKLQPDDVQGGTISLTNHGTTGSLFATPIINQPQCAILGIGKIEKRVKVINDAIAIRTMAYASLTFDHRILDGAAADGFMSTFKNQIENWS